MKAKIQKWLRIKKLEWLRNNGAFSYANHVEWCRLTESSMTIYNAQNIMSCKCKKEV